MSTAKMVFHGSDIEKICEVYHLNPKDIVKFGANVNPLGLSENVKEQLGRSSRHSVLLPGQRLYSTPQYHIRILLCSL